MDLEVARADRRLHPVAVAARVGERLRHRRLARAEEAQHAPPRRPRPLQHAPHRLGLERARPQPPELRRRPRQHDDGGPAGLEHDARARCPRARARSPPPGSVACLRTPCSKSAYGRRSRSATARETAPISLWSPSSTHRAGGPPPARRARPCGRRASGPARRRRGRRRPRAPRAAPPPARPAGRRRS